MCYAAPPMRVMRIAASSLLVAFVVAGCGASEPLLAADDPATAATAARALGTTKLRLMAGNLSTGNSQDYNSGHGIRIFQGCHPDIALVQELSYGADTEADIRRFVDTAFGSGFSYVRGAPTTIPNAIVSRYPIIASGEWIDSTTVDDRNYLWAHIDLPGANDLWAVSVHLSTNGSLRAVESAELLANIRSLVPPDDYLVIGGDFNTRSRTDISVNTLSGVVVTRGPYPVDQRGNENTNASRKEPYDWVVVSPALQALAVPTVMGSVRFNDGFVADTRFFTPIADLAPALASDSSGPSMQHMGVVRDFELATASPPPAASVKVVSPNGGEVFTVGTSQTIGWQATGVSSVEVAYSFDGFTFIDLGTPLPFLNTLVWSVPGPATASAVIRVRATNDAAISDLSDAVFTVQAPPPVATVQLLSPNGGETLVAGTTHTIRWASTGISHVDLAFSTDGVTFQALASAVDAAKGDLSWVVPSLLTSLGMIRISDSASSAVVDSSDTFFTVVAAPVGRVIINEVLANEPGLATAAEFIELVNIGAVPVDLSGWSLADRVAVRHRFTAGAVLPPKATLVVFANNTAAPVGITSVGASTGQLSLGNGGDTVTLADPAGLSVDSVTYDASLAQIDGVSMNRSPDRTAAAAFVRHTLISAANSSPGF